MSFSEQWHKADNEQKYRIRVRSALQSKIQHCSKMFWRENNVWVAKINEERHERDTWCQIVSLCLLHKYGISVEITKQTPLEFVKHEDSKPILNDEMFAASVDNETMSHIKGLMPLDWQIIYQVLSKAAYHKDPAQQVPAALEVLKKLSGNSKR